MDKNQSGKALELGSRNGGITLYLALKGIKVVCSDYDGVTTEAKKLHRKYKVEKAVTYAKVDATNITYQENYFDIVAFKSVLGGIGRGNNKAKQQMAFNEIYRVLKPNGLLLFAENLTGSRIHMLFRKKFITWGKLWRYVSIEELLEFTYPFSSFEYATAGICAAFGRTETQRKILHIFDVIVEPFINESNKYMIYGYARK